MSFIWSECKLFHPLTRNVTTVMEFVQCHKVPSGNPTFPLKEIGICDRSITDRLPLTLIRSLLNFLDCDKEAEGQHYHFLKNTESQAKSLLLPSLAGPHLLPLSQFTASALCSLGSSHSFPSSPVLEVERGPGAFPFLFPALAISDQLELDNQRPGVT